MRRILFLILIIPEFIIAQECNCFDSYTWLKKTFEENDAGYSRTIEGKGVVDYKQFCDSIELIVKNRKDLFECQQVLSNWTNYFRKGHIGVFINNNQGVSGDSNLSEKEIIEKYADTEIVEYDTISLNNNKFDDCM